MDEQDKVAGDEGRQSRRVFISYSTADRKQAQALCNSLERRGIKCWLASRDVAPGENYQESIVASIRAARAMVLVFSNAANKSDEIKKELSLASRYGVPVMALRIEDVEPSDAFAYELSTRQWIDAFRQREKAIDQLARRLVEDQAETHPGQRKPPASSFGFRQIPPRLLAGIAVLLLIVTAAAGWFFLQPSRTVMVAVLPFSDLSPGNDQAYFAEGIAEEILSTLAAEKDIKVLGRTSARHIERNPDPKTVRASLGVTHLLEGSTRSAGQKLRVNVRLVDTSDGSQLWEEQYDGVPADVFTVQDKIASTVVRRLRGTLLSGVGKTKATTIDVYQTYLAARALTRNRTKPALEEALGLARKVIDADPRYAPGHALYAELLFFLSDDYSAYGDLPLEKIRPIAERHARQAIALAPNKGEGYAALGLIQPSAQAIESFNKAITLDPARAEIRLWLGNSLNSLGHLDEGFAQYVAAAEIEPLWPVTVNQLIRMNAASGRFDEAEAIVGKFRARGGAENHALRFRAVLALYQNDISGSIALNRAALAKDPATPYVAEYAGQLSGFLGLTDQSLALIDQRATYVRMYYAGQRQPLRDRVIADGAEAWNVQGTDFGIFVLATFRDWPALARLYDWRPKIFADYCQSDPGRGALMVLALSRVGRAGEAQRLADCALRRADLELSMHNRWQGPQFAPEIRKASLLATRRDPRALDWLEKAVARGWIGQPFSPRLADWPQFDAYRSDPRYAALQKRIDGVVARERREALAAQ